MTVLNAGVATTNDLLRVHGVEDAIVAVGAAGTVIRSINRGATFSTTVTAPTVSQLQALWVFSQKRILGRLGQRLHLVHA